MIRRPPRSTLFPTRRSSDLSAGEASAVVARGCPSASAGVDSGRVSSSMEARPPSRARSETVTIGQRSEEHTSELQSRQYLVCRLLLEKKKLFHTALDYCCFL